MGARETEDHALEYPHIYNFFRKYISYFYGMFTLNPYLLIQGAFSMAESEGEAGKDKVPVALYPAERVCQDGIPRGSC